MIIITKVVSRNFVMDFYASIQNLLGQNLTPYERMLEKGLEQIKKEIEVKGYKFKWQRIEIANVTQGAIAIVFYGEQ